MSTDYGEAMSIALFLDHHFRHFNAGALTDAARAWVEHAVAGRKMVVTLAGAMSTAELGLSLAPLIRAGLVDAIVCTGANLEEDLFHLVAAEHYVRIPEWRDLSPADEADLLARKLNRVTDTCIPEDEAMRRVEQPLLELWQDAAETTNERLLPHEWLYRLFERQALDAHVQKSPKESWLYAAWEHQLPLFVPGWEDSTLGNHFASECLMDRVVPGIMRSGTDYMIALARWYWAAVEDTDVGPGFFQIGGGIAGDFPICVVPCINQDILPEHRAELPEVPLWSYFCQISDAPTSYGGYSGAPPNEKITWGKIGVDTPRFVIESDATIVAPLIFEYVREMVAVRRADRTLCDQ